MQRQFFRGRAELDSGALGAAVLYDVPERLLNDTIETKCNVLGQLPRDLVVCKLDVDPVLAGKLFAEDPDRRHEAEVIEDGGMQLMRQAMDVGRKLFRAP